MSKKFIEPFITSLPNRDLSKWNVINPSPINIDELTFNYNLTNFRFIDAAYDGSDPILDIGYDYVVFQVSGVNLTLAVDYEYVSEPPIFADIGTFSFGNTNFFLNFTT